MQAAALHRLVAAALPLLGVTHQHQIYLQSRTSSANLGELRALERKYGAFLRGVLAYHQARLANRMQQASDAAESLKDDARAAATGYVFPLQGNSVAAHLNIPDGHDAGGMYHAQVRSCPLAATRMHHDHAEHKKPEFRKP